MQQTLFENSVSDFRVEENSRKKKVKRLGEIPREWGVQSIGECIADLTAGKSVGGEDRSLNDGEKGIIRVSAVSYGSFRPDEYKVIPEARMGEVTVSPLKNKLIVSRANTAELVGASVFVRQDYPNLFLSDKLWQITPDEDLILPRWLHYWIWMPRIRFNIAAAATGSSASMKNISQRKFKSLRIPVPPKNEQAEILRQIRTWDRALAEIDAMIEAKQTRLKGLRQRLLTGDVRFPEFSEPWREVPIGDLLKRVRRHVEWDDDARYDLVSIKRDSGGMEFRESLFGSEISVKKLNTLKEGDFVISRMQVVHGATAYVPQKFDGHHASDSYYILIPRQNAEISTRFFAELSKLPRMYHLAYTSSYGVHIEKMSFNPSLYFKSKVEVPPTIEEQKQIVSFLKDIQHEIDQLRYLREARARQKKGMMQRLLLGEVRV